MNLKLLLKLLFCLNTQENNLQKPPRPFLSENTKKKLLELKSKNIIVKKIVQFDLKATSKEGIQYPQQINDIAWSNDNQKIFCCANKLSIINSLDGKLKYQRKILEGADNILLSPDETKIHINRLGYGNGHRDLLIYDLTTKQMLDGFENLGSPDTQYYCNPIHISAWSPCSKKIAAGFGSGHVLIYDIETKQTLHEFKFDNRIAAMAWSLDGNKIILNICDCNNSVALLDIESQDYEILYDHHENKYNTGPRISQFVWLSENIFAACSNNKIVYWNVTENNEIKVLDTGFTEDYEYDNSRGYPIKICNESTDCSLLSLSPDGKFLAFLKKTRLHSFGDILSILDINNKKFIAEDLKIFWFSDHNKNYYAEMKKLYWSKDSKYLAAVTDDKVNVWQLIHE